MTKPFHEMIVGAIERVKSISQLAFLASLVTETNIPNNHDNIAAAWTRKRKELGLGFMPDSSVFGRALTTVLQQKEEAERKATKKTRGAEADRAMSSQS